MQFVLIKLSVQEDSFSCGYRVAMGQYLVMQTCLHKVITGRWTDWKLLQFAAATHDIYKLQDLTNFKRAANRIIDKLVQSQKDEWKMEADDFATTQDDVQEIIRPPVPLHFESTVQMQAESGAAEENEADSFSNLISRTDAAFMEQLHRNHLKLKVPTMQTQL